MNESDKKVAKAQIISQAFITLGSIITAFGTLIFVTLLVENAGMIIAKVSGLVGVGPFGYGVGIIGIGLALILIGVFWPLKMIRDA